jgi:hypothetical protein
LSSRVLTVFAENYEIQVQVACARDLRFLDRQSVLYNGLITYCQIAILCGLIVILDWTILVWAEVEGLKTVTRGISERQKNPSVTLSFNRLLPAL